MVAPTGGGSLGVARGELQIDLSQLERAISVARAFSQTIEKTFAGVSTKGVEAGFERVANAASNATRRMAQNSLAQAFNTQVRQLEAQLRVAETRLSAQRSRFSTARIDSPFETGSIQRQIGQVAQPFRDARSAIAEMKAELKTAAPDFERIRGLLSSTQQSVTGSSGAIDRLGASITQFATRTQQAQRGIQGFFNTLTTEIDRMNERGLGRNLFRLGIGIAPLSLAAAAGARQGIGTAADLESIQLGFEGITGSQQRAVELMQNLRQEAERFTLPVNETLQAMQMLTPTLGANEAVLNNYVQLMARLRTLRPSEGLTGAAFAINEALVAFQAGGSDFISLAERFGVNRTALRQLTEQTGDFAEALDIMLDRMGRTEELAKRFGDTAAGSMVRAGDAVNRVLGAAFRTLLPIIAQVLERVADVLGWLETHAQGALTVLGGFALVAAGISPLIFVLSQVITLLETIKVIQASINASGLTGLARGASLLGRGAGVIAGGTIAISLGVELGKWVARGLADAGIGNDPRLRSDSGYDPGDILTERINQIIYVLTDAFYQLAAKLIELKTRFENAFTVATQGLVVSFKVWFAGFLQELSKIVGSIGEWLNSVIPGSGEGLRQQSSGLADRAKELGYEAVIDEYVLQRMMEELDDATGLTAEQAEALARRLQELREGNLEKFDDQFGVLDHTIEDLVAGMGNSSSAMTDLAATATEAFGEMQKLAEEAQLERSRLAEDRVTDSVREVEDFARKRAQDLADNNRELEKADRDQLQREAEQIEKIRELQDEDNAEQIERLEDFHRETERRVEDHYKKRNDILQQAEDDLSDALASRNGARAVDVIRNAERQLAKEDDTFKVQEERRQEDLQLEQQKADDQRQIKLAAAIQELADMRAQYAVQRDERQADFQRRLVLEQQEREIRFRRDREDTLVADRRYFEDLQRRARALLAESQLNDQSINALVRLFINARTIITGQSQAIVNSWLSIWGAMANAAQAPRTFPGRPAPTPYASGGFASANTLAMVGERGPELVRFMQPAQIYSNRESHAMLSGGGGNQYTWSGDLVVPGGGNIPPRMLEQIEQRVMSGMLQAARKMIPGA